MSFQHRILHDHMRSARRGQRRAYHASCGNMGVFHGQPGTFPGCHNRGSESGKIIAAIAVKNKLTVNDGIFTACHINAVKCVSVGNDRNACCCMVINISANHCRKNGFVIHYASLIHINCLTERMYHFPAGILHQVLLRNGKHHVAFIDSRHQVFLHAIYREGYTDIFIIRNLCDLYHSIRPIINTFRDNCRHRCERRGRKHYRHSHGSQPNPLFFHRFLPPSQLNNFGVCETLEAA